MAEITDDDDGAVQHGQPRPAPDERAGDERVRDEELPRFPEHVRQAILESEARILASWKKRGLFGLTTSTG